MYGNQTLTIADVKETLRSKQVTKKKAKEAEGLIIRERSENRNGLKIKKKRSKSKPKNMKYF